MSDNKDMMIEDSNNQLNIKDHEEQKSEMKTTSTNEYSNNQEHKSEMKSEKTSNESFGDILKSSLSKQVSKENKKTKKTVNEEKETQQQSGEMKQRKKSNQNTNKEYNTIVSNTLKLAPQRTDTFPSYAKRTESQKNFLMMASRESFVLDANKNNNESVKNESNDIDERWDADKCILDVIEDKFNCKKFTNFEWDDFNMLYKYATSSCTFDIDTKWIKINSENRYLTTSFGDSGIPAKFVLFYMLYQLKHVQTFEYLFDRMKLNRFSKSQNKDSKKNFAWRLFYDSVRRFSDNLYDSLVETRRRIGIQMYPSLSEGRSESFQCVIENLDACKFIVDGKNQTITDKYIKNEEGKRIKDAKYYNYKQNSSGVKILAFIDCMGLCVNITKHFPASIHDSTVYNEVFDGSLIPEFYYCMGDGGFRGCARCICNYPRTAIQSSAEGRTFVTGREEKVIIFHGNNVVPGVGGFYGVLVHLKNETKMRGFFEGHFIISNYLEHFKIEGEATVTECFENDDKKYLLKKFESKNKIEAFENSKIEILCKCYGYSANTQYLKVYNIALSSIRISVENYFGRTNLLWNAASCPYKWSLSIYDSVTKCIFAATNFHTHLMPIRKFPFQLFCFNSNNSLGIKLSHISKLKIPNECLKIIGIESDDEIKKRGKTIGSYYNIKGKIKGPLPEKLFVKVPQQEEFESFNFINSMLEDNSKIPSSFQLEVALKEIENKCFNEINIDQLFNYYGFNMNEINKLLEESEIEGDTNKMEEYYDNMNDLFNFDDNLLDKKIEKEKKEMEIEENEIKEEKMEIEEIQEKEEKIEIENYEEKEMKMEIEEKETKENEFEQSEEIKNVIELVESDEVEITHSTKPRIDRKVTHFNPISLDQKELIIPADITATKTLKGMKRKLDSQLFSLYMHDNKKYIDDKYYFVDDAWFDRIMKCEDQLFERNIKELDDMNKVIQLNEITKRLFGKKFSVTEKIIFCCCHNRTHWTLAILEIEYNSLIILDSMNGSNNHNKLLKYLNVINICKKNISIKKLIVKDQEDLWSCGYHMVYYLNNLFINQKEQNYLEVVKFDENKFNQIMETMEIYFNKLKSIVYFRLKCLQENKQILDNGIDITNYPVEDIYIHLINNNYLFDEAGYLECLKKN